MSTYDDIEDVYVLAPTQAGLLSHAVERPGSAAYLMQMTYEWPGVVDLRALQRAWRVLVQRHPILRTAFHWEGLSEAHQVVFRSVDAPLECVDLRVLWPESAASEARRLADQQRGLGFDLQDPCCMRACLVRMPEGKQLLIWSYHHILLDGWSISILLAELGKLYISFSTGIAADLPERPKLGGYIGWLRNTQALGGEEFWRDLLRDFADSTPVPGDHGARRTGSGYGSVESTLSETQSEKIREAVKNTRVTLGVVLQAAWALVLGRYATVHDVVFGVTSSGRNAPYPGLDKVVGLLIVTLPVRVKWTPDQSVRALLDALREQQAVRSRYETVPIGQIHEWSGTTGKVLYETIVVVQNYPTEMPWGDVRERVRLVDAHDPTHYALTLGVTPGASLHVKIQYDASRISSCEAHGILRCLETVLLRMGDDPSASVASVVELDAIERHQLCVEESPSLPLTGQPWLHAGVRRHATRSPDAIAVCQGDEQFSYGWLYRRARCVAGGLRQWGVRPEVRVALLLDRSLDLLVAILGVLEAGGAYVPLDAQHPTARLSRMLEKAAASLVITQCELEERLPALDTPVLTVDELVSDTPLEPAFEPSLTVHSAAYLIFTSGSSGQPKGVVLTHGSAANLAAAQARAFELDRATRTLQFASPGFDASVSEIFATWEAGGTVVILPQAELSAGAPLTRALRRHAISWVTLPPAVLAICEADRLPALETVVSAGDTCSHAIVEAWTPGRRFINAYGPTEATVCATWTTCFPGSRWGATPMIGRRLANQRIHVLDEDLRMVPPGASGELFIGGVGVARGYLDAAFTAERFVPDPFADEPGARMYRTGDRVLRHRSGELEFRGRRDRQVKIRGHRIELGEIDAALRELSGVADCATLVRLDAQGEPTLASYVVPRAAELEIGTVREHLEKHLPRPMIPAEIVLLSALPRGMTGKVDIKALPVADEPRAREGAEGLHEELLTGIWGDVLGRDGIGPTNNFFELGGHSLAAAQVVARIQRVFGVELTVRDIFECLTVRQLTERVRARCVAVTAESGTTTRIEPQPDESTQAPLSFSQERIWLAEAAKPTAAPYNIPGLLRMRGRLDMGALRRSFDAVVRRHEILRTRFFGGDDGPRQEVVPASPRWLPVVDLSALPSARRDALLPSLVRAAVARRFELEVESQVRLAVIRLDPTDHRMIIVLHHIVADAWSMSVLTREISAHYQVEVERGTLELPELRLQYRDYAHWQRHRYSGEAVDDALAYWREVLDGAPTYLRPFDRRPARATTESGDEVASVRVSLELELSGALMKFVRERDATPFMLMSTAFATLLARHSGVRDVVIGVPADGRGHDGLAELIGLFINMVPFRVTLGGDVTTIRLLEAVREQALQVHGGKELPFSTLVSFLPSIGRHAGSHPLFQNVVQLIEAPPGGRTMPAGLLVESETIESYGRKFDLELTLVRESQQFSCSLQYATGLYERTAVQRFLGHFVRLLEQMSEAPDVAVSQLCVMSPGERHQVTVERVGVWPALPERRLEVLFALQVERTPDAVAVQQNAQHVTYRALERIAASVAADLAAVGVTAGDIVGVCLDRSVEEIAAELGILAVGAAYLPLDPAAPQRRQESILRSCDVRVVVTASDQRQQWSPFTVVSVECGGGACRVPARDVELPAAPDAVAYVMHTSGTTGVPKGVCISHGAVVALVHGTSFVPFESRRRIAHISNPAFDAATFDIWGALLFGGVVVVLGHHEVIDAEAFGEKIVEYGLESFFLTAALFRKYANEAPHILAPAREVLVGGDRVDPGAARAVLRAGPPARLLNGYGPTETTTFALWDEISLRDAEGPSIPIGRPLANSSAWVLDDSGEPTPIGVIGELFLGGRKLALGLYGSAGTTASRFVPSPFGDGTRLYRTGDMARVLPDGRIECLGRRDRQVKIRGYRVELEEIESSIALHPRVAACVVAMRAGELIAVVVPKPTAAIDRDSLLGELREGLPSYMIPVLLEVMAHDEIPLTANGKLDRRALLDRPLGGAEGTASSSWSEDVITSIFGDLLHRDVAADDNFFAIGGHSLLASQAASRVSRALSIQMPLSVIFEHPSARALARRAEALRSGGESKDVSIPLRPAIPRPPEIPLSFAQERLWLAARHEDATQGYNVPAVFRLVGIRHLEPLQRAFYAVVERHEILRTRFVDRGGTPIQEIQSAQGFECSVVDLRAVNDALEVAKQIARDEILRAFELSTGPLIRVSLLRVADDVVLIVMVLHHIISDGWSQTVLAEDLAHFHRAFTMAEEPRLEPLRVQYADYSVWQRRVLDEERLARDLGYWREQLEELPPCMDLAFDRPRPHRQSYQGKTVAFSVDEATRARAWAVARSASITPFMFLLGAFAMVLARHAGRDDVVVGVPISGRNEPAVERMVGCFVNMLVIRIRVRSSQPISALLETVREACLGAFEHQHVPFEKLVAELAERRSLSHHPMFQVGFQLFEGAAAALGLPEPQELIPEAMVSTTSKYDLKLDMSTVGGELAGSVEFASDLFDTTTIRRLQGQLMMAIRALLDSREARVGDVALLDEAQAHQILVEWNDSKDVRGEGPTILSSFAVAVRRSPDAIAVEDGVVRLSYLELDRRANQIAHWLRCWGGGRGSRIGLFLPRSAALIAWIIGVIKAGGAFVPVDPAQPIERNMKILADSGAVFTIAVSELIEQIPSTGDLVFCAEEQEDEIRAMPVSAPELELRGDDIAYVMHTSGSKGRPKGVIVSHEGLANYVHWARSASRVRADDLVALHSSPAFDLTITSIFVPLVAGARVLVPQTDRVTGGESIGLDRSEDHALLKLTPSHLDLLALDLHAGTLRGRPRCVFVGGEALTKRQLAPWHEAWGDTTRFINEYGPTETVVGCSAHEVGDFTGDGPVAIGRPIANARLVVVDGEGRPQPIGLPGELYVGGVGVAQGYLGRRGETAERFTPDPWSDVPGARCYRTGDLVRRTADGTLIYLGRTDDQVKIRGYRVELGEIEALISDDPHVRHAGVVMKADGAQPRLVAYVVPEPGAEAPVAGDEMKTFVDRLQQSLASRLPEYMKPSELVVLDAMPLTHNGKIDRTALLRLTDRRKAQGQNAEGPRDGVEELLAAIWRDVLGVDDIGVRDDFFQLGGHSLSATQVIARVRDVCDVELTLQHLFEAPTIAGLADAIRGRDDSLGITTGPERAPDDSGPAPLSFAQGRLWFLARLEPDHAAYHIPSAVTLRGPVEIDSLRDAVREIVRRHESLRTHIHWDGESATQRILDHESFEIPLVDLGDLDESAKAPRARTLAGELARQPFSLERGPLLRVVLMRLDRLHHVLLCVMHHVVSDGWSTSVLVDELCALYEAALRGDDRALPPLPFQYSDYARWQRANLDGPVMSRLLERWMQLLAGAPTVLRLPTDRPRPARQSYRGRGETLRLTDNLREQVAAFARARRVTPFMVLLAAYGIVLGQYTGQDDLLVAVPTAGRGRVEFERLIGLFVNSITMRVRPRRQEQLLDVLEAVQRHCIAAYRYDALPFERLVLALSPQRALDHQPVTQVGFQVVHGHMGSLRSLADLTLEPAQAESESTQYDLKLDIVDADALEGRAEYAVDLFDRVTIRRLLAHFTRAVEALVHTPEATVAEVVLMTEPERHQLLIEWNRWEGPVGASATIGGCFAAVVARHESAVAVECDGRMFRYGELGRLVVNLGLRLRQRGIPRGSRIGLCVARTEWLTVALLGVLEGGCSYVAIDPEHPKKRMDWMLEDSGAVAVVVDETTRGLFAVEEIEVDGPPAEGPVVTNRSSAEEAYVLYTSGSTGRPKGVSVSHAAVLNLLTGMAEEPGLTREDTLLAVTSISFDIAAVELLLPLMVGARVVVATTEQVRDGAALMDVLWRRRIDVMQATPSTWRMLLGRIQEGVDRLPEGLRAWSGGEALDRALVEDLRGIGVAEIWNLYGPTETCIWSTMSEVGDEIDIGRPARGTQVHVLDATGQPVLGGAEGELYIGGEGVATGYVGRAAETADCFVPDPWRVGQRMYRTGDRVRGTSDGRLEFIGRNDQQVKVRGHRVALGEVEAALLRAKGVGEAAVVLRGDALVGYVVMRDGSFDEEALNNQLREELPHAMVPQRLFELERLQRTSSGKIDRATLPVRPTDSTRARPRSVRTSTEALMAQIWGSVLGTEPPGSEDGFFALGGHSLQATRVIARVERYLGVRVPIRVLFEHPTLAGFSRAVQELRADDAPMEASSGSPGARNSWSRLSHAQERLWFLHRLAPDQVAYNIGIVLRLAERVQIGAMQRALRALVDRHWILAVRIDDHDGEPRQRARSTALEVSLVDLRGLDDRAASAAFDEVGLATHGRPFDLERDGLVRVVLVSTRAEDSLLIAMHHILVDAWSIGILVREFEMLYLAELEHRSPELAPSTWSYADYARWQRDMLERGEEARQTAYWREALRGAPATLALPLDRPRTRTALLPGSAVPIRLGEALTDKLERAGRDLVATPFMLVASAFGLTLSRLTGAHDLVVGVPVAHRDRAELEDVVGPMLNTVPLRMTLRGCDTASELVAMVRDRSLGALSHQELPFEVLLKNLNMERRTEHHPVFQVMVEVQMIPHAAREHGLVCHAMPVPITTSKFELDLALYREESAYCGTLTFRTDLFDRTTVQRMAGMLHRALAALVDDADPRLECIDLLSEGQRHQVAVELPTGPAPHVGAPLFARIRSRLRERPDAVVISDGARQLTARALDAASAELSATMQRSGVGRGRYVGIQAVPSLESVASILAVMRAGAAWVPLDPTWPAARTRYIVEDAGITHVVCCHGDRIRFQDLNVCMIPGELGRQEGAIERDAVPDRERADSSIAYVIYTSGSTGRPKGTINTDQGLRNIVDHLAYSSPCRADTVLVHRTPLPFDVSAWEVMLPLSVGARLAVFDAASGQGGASQEAYMHEERVGIAYFVPSSLKRFLREWSGVPITSLSHVICGGERLSPELLAEFLTTLGAHGVGLENSYGPSECAIAVSGWRCDGAVVRETPIGVPLSGTSLHVVDADMMTVALGVEGEIVASGVGVGLGYVGRPALTAEAFVPDSLSGASGSTAYRTGDRGRWRSDGQLEFRGRIDAQVKINGVRIDPGEVEAALGEHPGVADVAVVDGADHASLIAIVVGRSSIEPSELELRDHLLRTLPTAMMPSALIMAEAIPRLVSGKTDAAAIRGMASKRLRPGGSKPRDEVEQQLVEVWQQVLGRTEISRGESFFALGGDSISGLRVVASARERGLHFVISDLFEAQTIEALASRVRERRRTELPTQEPVIGPVALSPIQRLLFERYRGNWDRFNQSVMLRSHRRLDSAALSKSLAAIERQHDVLRYRFARVDGRWSATSVAEVTGLVEVVDLTCASPAQYERLRTRAADQVQGSLNLEKGPIQRFVIFRGPDAAEDALWVIHHSIVDLVSWGILLDDLQRAYRSACQRRDPGLEAKTTSFDRWLAVLAKQVSDDNTELAVSSWETRAAGHWSRPPWLDGERYAERNRVDVTLDRATSREILEQIPDLFDCTVQDLLLAAVARVWARESTSARIAIDVESHGRDVAKVPVDVSRTVGWFTTLHRAYFDSTTGGGFRDYVVAAKRHRLERGRSGHGFLEVAMLTGPLERARMGRFSTASLLFNYMGRVGQAQPERRDVEFIVVGEARGRERDPGLHGPHPVEIDCMETGGEFVFGWTFSDPALASDIRRVAHSVERELTVAVQRRASEGDRADSFQTSGLSPRKLKKLLGRIAPGDGD